MGSWHFVTNKPLPGYHNVSAVALGNFSSMSTPGCGEYSYVPHVYQALIGRVNYDYDLKYLFEVNMGYNGSNRFAKGRRYQLFPAASVGWILNCRELHAGNYAVKLSEASRLSRPGW
jgi:hypothetical protein